MLQLQDKDKRKKQIIYSVEKMAEPTRRDNNTKSNSRIMKESNCIKPLVKI